jgi:hypothetical protein
MSKPPRGYLLPPDDDDPKRRKSSGDQVIEQWAKDDFRWTLERHFGATGLSNEDIDFIWSIGLTRYLQIGSKTSGEDEAEAPRPKSEDEGRSNQST